MVLESQDITYVPASPLDKLPCANVEPEKQWSCPNQGTMFCAKCQLVGYCSKDCQIKHWLKHKYDCKDPIRSSDWTPAWVLENRQPSSIGNDKHSDKNWAQKMKKEQPLAIGMHLWGNIPAFDFVNIERNEGISTPNLQIASVASGDLRHIVRTINQLPDSYSGTIDILLNDREPVVVLRNIILLLVLGTVPDKVKAADIALHFWYSAFVPAEYDVQLLEILVPFLGSMQETDEGKTSFMLPLGNNSTLSGVVTSTVIFWLSAMTQAQHDVSAASREMNRVRFALSRQDRHHRHYCRLEPSHRLAFLEFRRFGLVLPFGARNDTFSSPNRFLFSPEGTWLQDDLANPLDSWEIPPIINAGKLQGATRADIYGCFYFYLSNQLRIFADRLGQLTINFRLFSEDVRLLSDKIRKDALAPYGIPASTRFDRIHVSNIIDVEYVGIPGVLDDWGPLLKDNDHATILGYSMNWPLRQNDANASSSDPKVSANIIKKWMEQGRMANVNSANAKRAAGLLLGYLTPATVGCENSKVFQQYLEKLETQKALRQAKLKLKEPHTIVPHRLCAPLEGSPNALPYFSDNESWYLNVCVGSWMWSERFVEICRA